MAINLVVLKFQDRQIGKLMLQGLRAELIAEPLEISVNTVNRRISRMCRWAEVEDRCQLVLWFLENPKCLIRGARTPPGLHPGDCQCCPFCRDLHARMMA